MSYDFTTDGYEDPGPDVLDNGLPPLPETLEVAHGVAVARWVDGDLGVVLCVYRNDPADEPDEDSFYEYGYDVQPYQRINGSWESTGGSGGSNWHSPPFERYPGLSRFAVSAGHFHQQQSDGAPPIRVVDGLVGEGVVSVETVHRGHTHVMPIESPIGAWVAGVVGDGPAQWVARDAAGRVAASGELDPAGPGFPSWFGLDREASDEALNIEEDGDGFGLTSFITTLDDTRLTPEEIQWFQRRVQGGRLPNEEYIQVERMPEWQRIASDLRATTAIELKVVGYPHADIPQATMNEIFINGVVQGAFTDSYVETAPELSLVDFADLLCEQYLHEEVWGGWPICPVHQTHPLDPGLNDVGVASWICPTDAVSIRIGSLTKEALESHDG